MKAIIIKVFVIAAIVFLSCLPASANKDSITSFSFSLRDTPKYKEGFTHFDYVNPDAPKGGSITLAAIGTFDNFNRYAQRGDAAEGSDMLYDTLMTPSDDEIDVLYPMIAKKIEYAKNHTWIIFYINPKAKFQDGRAISADDVVFSFNTFMTQGVIHFRNYYKDVEQVTALDSHKVKFTLNASRPDILHGLAGLHILPKHYWKNRDFSEPASEVPLGSSGFTIDSYKMGQYVIIKRLKDYWAKDLPANKGRNNFDFIRYDYYKDELISLEAFKAGDIDFRSENIATQWASSYTGENFDKKNIIKEEIQHEIPQPMQAFVYNTERPIFKDIRVREALAYAMDFEWMNHHLFHDQYTRSRSFFQNTEYEAASLPSQQELDVLKPIKNKIPKRVYTEEYQPPATNGSGNIRPQMRKALALLKKAGWEVRDRKMTNMETNMPMTFELMIFSPTWERVAIPFQNNLKKLGITMNIRKVDTSQYINRLRSRDFDMISGAYAANTFPSTNMKLAWHSAYIDSTYNQAGVTDPAIDYLIEKIDGHQTDKKALLAYGKALDRVLQWNFFVIPQWHMSRFRVAYWNKFARPEIRPKYALGFADTWWLH